MEKTLFTKIIKGEIPSYKIYEDDKTYAFLDINPKGKGHTLVVPKKPYTYLWDMPEDEYLYLMKIVRKIAKHHKDVMKKEFVRIDVVGTDVPHTHVHVIPFNLDEEMIEGAPLKFTEEEFKTLANELKI